MDIGLVQLRVSAAELTPAFLLVETPAILMIECQVPNGAPTIRNQYGWRKARHSLPNRLSFYANLLKKGEIQSQFLFSLFVFRTGFVLSFGRFCSHFLPNRCFRVQMSSSRFGTKVGKPFGIKVSYSSTSKSATERGEDHFQ